MPGLTLSLAAPVLNPGFRRWWRQATEVAGDVQHIRGQAIVLRGPSQSTIRGKSQALSVQPSSPSDANRILEGNTPAQGEICSSTFSSLASVGMQRGYSFTSAPVHLHREFGTRGKRIRPCSSAMACNLMSSVTGPARWPRDESGGRC